MKKQYNHILSPLLSTWERTVREHVFPSKDGPWWLDHAKLLQSIAMAAEALGWEVRPRRKPDDPSEVWDLHCTTSDAHVAIRCLCAAAYIGPGGEERNAIADAWRYLFLTARPPSGTEGVHLVAVLPLVKLIDDEEQTRQVVEQWLATSHWRGDDGRAVWIEAVPMLRNSAGTAFPGMGLIARMADPQS